MHLDYHMVIVKLGN